MYINVIIIAVGPMGHFLLEKHQNYKISKNSIHIVCSCCHILVINHLIEPAKKKHIQSFFQLLKILKIFVHFKTLRYKNIILSKSLVAYFISASENQICW